MGALQSVLRFLEIPIGGLKGPCVWGPHKVPPISVEKRLKCEYVCMYMCTKPLLYRGFVKPPLYSAFYTHAYTHFSLSMNEH